jgi:hypothetical protein
LDIIGAIVAVFAFAVALVIAVLLFDAFIAEGVFSGDALTFFQDAKSATLGLDALSVVLVVGVCLSSLILAFMVRSHPAFFLVSFMVTLLAIPIAAQIANIYEEFATYDADLQAASNQLPYTYFVFEYLPKITAVFSALIAVVMYSKGGP